MNIAASTVSRDLSVSRAEAVEWSSWFRAIGDPTRILILNLLSTERRAMSVGEITERLDVGQSTISHHLSKLADVRFVLVERMGAASYWQVNECCLGAFPSAAQIILGQVPESFRDAQES